MAGTAGRASELAELLEEASFHITQARGAGLERTDELRAALRRARELLVDADALAADVAAARRTEERP